MADPNNPGEDAPTHHWDEEKALQIAALGILPDDLVELSASRLRPLLGAGAAGFAGLLAYHVSAGSTAVPSVVLGLAVSALGFGLTWIPGVRPRHLNAFAPVALLTTCFVLAYLRYLLPLSPSAALLPLSPAILPLLGAAALLPASHKGALVQALLAAATDPLALLASGNSAFGSWVGWVAPLPMFGAALVATAVSRSVHRMTAHIEEARKIGSYELLSPLGRGGMAEVWRARHRMLQRPAAIKLIRPAVLSGHGPEEAARLVRLFLREARTTSGLSSPHTIQLYDFGVAREGGFYFVMELLDGVDFQALVEEHGPLPEERVAHLLSQAAESLAEAHAKNFVHRDVKPGNLFTCRVGLETDFVKVLDFGLVLDRHPTAEELEDEKRFVGTPSIMAPEMVRFQAPVDARADIYALGCVGYWLLTGHRIFEAKTRADMLVMHAHQRPVAPSKRRGVPLHAGMEGIVMRCLEKNPAKRPQTCQELIEDIRALQFEHPWTEERSLHWWRAHRHHEHPAPSPEAASKESVSAAAGPSA